MCTLNEEELDGIGRCGPQGEEDGGARRGSIVSRKGTRALGQYLRDLPQHGMTQRRRRPPFVTGQSSTSPPASTHPRKPPRSEATWVYPSCCNVSAASAERFPLAQ